MTRVLHLDRDDEIVRELLAPLARVQPVTLARRASGERRRFRAAVMVAAASAALVLVGGGVAAATGVLPWWKAEQAVTSSPFFTSADPARIAGSTVRLFVPGPGSTSFEVVTNDTISVGTGRQHCVAIVVEDVEGRSRRRGLTSCGGAGAAVAEAGSFEWQAPSGDSYVVVAGPVPISTATTVAFRSGAAKATGSIGDGYYLVYAPADLHGNLFFYDERGQVVAERDMPRHPQPSGDAVPSPEG